MFSVVPHSFRLSHLDSSLYPLWECRKFSKHEDHDGYSDSSDEESDRRSLISQITSETVNEISVAGSAEQDPQDDPRILESPAKDKPSRERPSALEKQIILSPCSSDSAFSSLPPQPLKGSSESTDKQDPDTLTGTESPQMLSQARLSSFKFVEFTALHETNVIHRLPSTDSLLSSLSEEFNNSPRSSPCSPRKTSTRSRRRCIQCGGLIQFGKCMKCTFL